MKYAVAVDKFNSHLMSNDSPKYQDKKIWRQPKILHHVYYYFYYLHTTYTSISTHLGNLVTLQYNTLTKLQFRWISYCSCHLCLGTPILCCFFKIFWYILLTNYDKTQNRFLSKSLCIVEKAQCFVTYFDKK